MLRPHGPNEGGEVGEEQGAAFEIDSLDLKLPCRVFDVSYQVADASTFSLTTEFLLRLLKAVDELTEAEVATFFGFSLGEAAHVIGASERKGYVSRGGGRVQLTEAGDALFDKSPDKPALYEVQRKSGYFSFDLVSFCPIRREYLSEFAHKLPELPLPNPELAANASKEVTEAFRKHFREIQVMEGGPAAERLTLYSIDHVVGQTRSAALVPVSIKVRRDTIGTVEPDLLGWKSGVDLQNRIAVLSSCGALLREYSVQATFAAESGASYLHECAPRYIERFFRGNQFDAAALFRRASRLVGDLRKDRKTACIYGTLWTKRNLAKIVSALQYVPEGTEDKLSPLVWLRPSIASWGCSSKLPDLVENLAPDAGLADTSYQIGTVLITNDNQESSWRFSDVFDVVATLQKRKTPQNFEMLLIPQRVFAALVYVPLSGGEGYPIPMGIVSFEPAFLRAAHELMADIVAEGKPTTIDTSNDSRNLAEELAGALKFSERQAEGISAENGQV